MELPDFPGVPGLVHDFDPGSRFNGYNIHVIESPGYSHMPDPHAFSTSSKPPIGFGYAGYIVTKNPPEHAGQKETWAIVNREHMPASQADLKSQVEKSRKRGVTGLDQYMDSKNQGFKRKQVDELIRECIRMDPDQRFVYIIASIKRHIRRQQSGPKISTMQVILKRQPRAGTNMQGPPFIGLVAFAYRRVGSSIF